MMHPTGIGPSPNLIPQHVAAQRGGHVPDNAGLKPQVPIESNGLQEGIRYAPDTAVSTRAQLEQRGASQSADAPGASPSPASQESAGAFQPKSASGQQAESGQQSAGGQKSAGDQAKQPGDLLKQLMNVIQSVGESIGKIGQMVMDGIGKAMNMVTPLISSAASMAKSVLPM
ncbi:hypothetical protein ACVHYJ_17515 [Burkholderia pyrrocinia]